MGGKVVNIASLYDLQKIDVALIKARQRLRQIQQALEESDELKQARRQVAETEAELNHWEAKQKDSELESQSLAQRISSTDATLMSGDIKNPKELESMQASLEALRRQRESVDDQSVEAMLMVEQISARLATQKSTLSQLLGDWKSQQTELIKEGKALQKQAKQFKVQRTALAEKMSDTLVERYEQLRKRKAGIAIAPLRGDSCGACHMQVPSGVISAVHSSQSKEVLCPSCGRILISE